jgi:CRISPR-associated protein Cmr6
LKVKKAEESSSTTIEYRNNRYEYIRDIFKNLKDEKGNDISIDLSDSEIKILEFAIFAGTNAEGESLVFPERDIFLDAVVVAASTGLIGTDYITPHKDPLKDPKPIQFFKILPNVEFQFSFKLSNTILYDKKAYTEKGFEKLKSKAKEKEAAFDTAKIISVDMKKAVFKQIILDFGIGAKTNVGYGQFSK